MKATEVVESLKRRFPTAPEYIQPDENMDSVMRKFEKTGAWNLPVVDEDRRYCGFLSKSKIFSAYREELKDFSQD